jgi:hypothetical protein
MGEAVHGRMQLRSLRVLAVSLGPTSIRVSSITLEPGAQAMNSPARTQSVARPLDRHLRVRVHVESPIRTRKETRSGVFAGFPSVLGTLSPLQAMAAAACTYIHSRMHGVRALRVSSRAQARARARSLDPHNPPDRASDRPAPKRRHGVFRWFSYTSTTRPRAARARRAPAPCRFRVGERCFVLDQHA